MGNDTTPATPRYTHLISDERWGETCLVDNVEQFVRDMEESMFPASVAWRKLSELQELAAESDEECAETLESLTEGWRGDVRAALQEVGPVTLADGRTAYMTTSEAVYVETANGLASYEGEWSDLKPIRLRVREGLENGEHVTDALRKAHERNYETLYVDRDGSCWWADEIDSNTWRTHAGGPTPSLAKVGTGSTPCNCDWCQGPDAVDSTSEIEFEAGELSHQSEDMQRRLDEIPVGYFDDEIVLRNEA